MAETRTPTFTADERAAVKAAAKERKAEQSKAENEKAAVASIASMPTADRELAEKVSAIIAKIAPSISRKTYYGMPAWQDEDGKTICFFKNASKFKTRYASFEFNDSAALDSGDMWPISYALVKVGAAEEKTIGELVTKALS